MADEAPQHVHRRHRWLVGSVLTLAVIIGVLACLSVWVKRQVFDNSHWTSTSSQVLADPKVQDALGTVLVTQLFNSVDVAGQLKSLLPSGAEGLAAPAAAGLRQLALQAAPEVLALPQVQDAWRNANSAAQKQLVTILNGGGKTVSTQNGEVTLSLGQLVAQIGQQIGVNVQAAQINSALSSAGAQSAQAAAKQKLGITLPATTGTIVLMKSSELKTAQDLVKAIKGLSILLPLIAFALFILAVWLAQGWRREAVRAVGWSFVAIGLIVILARRLLGNEVVDALVKVPENKPAVHDAFDIATTLLYDIAVAMITYGLVFVVAAWSVGPTRAATSLRRTIAPTMRLHVGRAYAAAALALLLVIIWGPFPSTRQLLPLIGMAILLALGVRTMQHQAVAQFPDAEPGDTMHSLRGWYDGRRERWHQRGSNGSVSHTAELERLAQLHRNGDLSDEEYAAHKQALLSGS
jgi:hypothetical protein